MDGIELTILMPCLNEAETLEVCIKKALLFLEKNHVSGEVLIADNGSTDSSVLIAEKNGARVIEVPVKGYGSALRHGINSALGKYVIMGDADDSYDFFHLMPFLTKLREGYDLVMGNRFTGGIEKGAMPFSHRYIGNPVLSFIGRVLFGGNIRDWHCGLRGFNRQAILSLGLTSDGMEFASEMVLKALSSKLLTTEVPTTLKPDGRSRKPHLRTFRDGWRHLKLLVVSRIRISRHNQ
ncbi:MAG: glycosyltransferase family 2 protein [Mogibacterium sp.]|nr:glycosyltransferase family 2 protein [Mogibacterium sp.]